MNHRIATGIVLLGLAGVAIIAPASGPVDHTHGRNALPGERGDSLVSVQGIERSEDGTWWVLERSLTDEAAGAVYAHDTQWRPTGERHGITLPAEESDRAVVPVDLAEHPNGTWYVLGENGRVYVFDASWTYTGRSFALPREQHWRVSRSDALEWTESGWWVDAYGELVLYDPEFERVLARYDPYDDLELGEAYYNDYYGRMTVGNVLVLDGTDDELVFHTSLADHHYVFRGGGIDGLASPAPNATVSPGYNPSNVDDFERGPDGARYIVTSDGTLYEYTESWLYTGTDRRIGSGFADRGLPPHIVSPAIVLVPIVRGALRLVPVVYVALVLGGLRWTDTDAESHYLAAAASGTVAYAVFYEPWPLRPLLFVSPAVLALGLVSVCIAIAAHLVYERDEGLGLATLYAPVLYALGATVLALV